jgi:hypothetical protein
MTAAGHERVKAENSVAALPLKADAARDSRDDRIWDIATTIPAGSAGPPSSRCLLPANIHQCLKPALAIPHNSPTILSESAKSLEFLALGKASSPGAVLVAKCFRFFWKAGEVVRCAVGLGWEKVLSRQYKSPAPHISIWRN